MSSFYTPTLVAHVLVAILGLGSIVSIAIVAGAARRNAHGPAETLPWLDPLLRYSAISLAAMLVTGILLDLAARGVFRGAWWFRLSALLLVSAGILHGQARRTARLGISKQVGIDSALRRIERIAYAIAILIMAITVLMEVKPF